MAVEILVVEDDLATLELMTDVLQHFDVRVHPLSDSEAASTLVNKKRFEGIFLDLMMPRLDGFRLTRAIRASTLNRTTPIIMVTGSNERRVMHEAFQAGANFFLPKPIDRNRLALLLNTTRGAMLSNRRSLRRVPLHMQVKLGDTHSGELIWCLNLSERGLMLKGSRSLHPGMNVKLSFLLPGQDDIIRVTGLVVRTDEQLNAGVRFVSLRHADRLRIQLFISEELTQGVDGPVCGHVQPA
jgi:CheY-like chemotaxis protein